MMQMNAHALTFTQGKFLLTEAPEAVSKKLRRDAHWEWTGSHSFTTVSLRAAAAFRHLADETVEKIFLRTFQAHYEVPSLPPLPELDPHQREGLEWILSRKRAYLAHAPGAGKTAQAILGACLARGPGQVLFIVPPALVRNWEREIYKVTEWLGIWPTIGIVPRSEFKHRMAWLADFILCPDSMLDKAWVHEKLYFMRKKFIAVDEASRFKDPAADRSLAFYGGRSERKSFRGLFQKARHVVFLDGSPMPNRPIELWAPTYALHPETIDCRDYDDFGYRYCGARPNDRGQWEYLYSSHEGELQAKLKKDFMHVVLEEELKHPSRRRSLLFLGKSTAEIRAWERKNLTGLLKQIADGGETVSRGQVASLRHDLGIAKVKPVASYVRDRLLEKNESILLFAWHRSTCLKLGMELSEFAPGIIMGGTPAEERERVFDLFQKKKKKLLILNIAAGGRGHNLQAADRVIFAEYSWTDETNKQCEKRASRRGSGKAMVRCEYAVVPESLDEAVLSSIFTKESRVKRIIG